MAYDFKALLDVSEPTAKAELDAAWADFGRAVAARLDDPIFPELVTFLLLRKPSGGVGAFARDLRLYVERGIKPWEKRS